LSGGEVVAGIFAAVPSAGFGASWLQDSAGAVESINKQASGSKVLRIFEITLVT
jgi:hypothetical protein